MSAWKETTVDEISEYVTVGFVGSMAHEYLDQGVLFLRSQNIHPYKLNLNKSQIKFISNKFHKKLSKSKLVEGDIAMVRTGYPGTCCVIPQGMGELNCSDLVIIRPDKNKVEPNFLSYFLNSPVGKASIGGNLVGAAQQHFNVGVAKKIKLHLPELKLQHKIAYILSNYDNLIENNNQRIQLLEEMAGEIYTEWFVRLRFPGYENAVFRDKDGNEVDRESDGALPDGWDTLRIKNIGKVITGKTPSKQIEEYFGSDIPFIKTPDMSQGLFFIKTDESLSIKGANSQIKQYVPENSICISCIGTVGKIGLTITKCQTNQQINSLIPKQKAELEYLYFTLLRMRPIIESYAATGATMANLSKSKFENLRLVKPSSVLTNDFHGIVNPIFQEIKILLQKNQVLQESRDLLLPRLISGKLSVEHLLKDEGISLAAEPQTNYKAK